MPKLGDTLSTAEVPLRHKGEISPLGPLTLSAKDAKDAPTLSAAVQALQAKLDEMIGKLNAMNQ